jgi:hypothetical protein
MGEYNQHMLQFDVDLTQPDIQSTQQAEVQAFQDVINKQNIDIVGLQN